MNTQLFVPLKYVALKMTNGQRYQTSGVECLIDNKAAHVCEIFLYDDIIVADIPILKPFALITFKDAELTPDLQEIKLPTLDGDKKEKLRTVYRRFKTAVQESAIVCFSNGQFLIDNSMCQISPVATPFVSVALSGLHKVSNPRFKPKPYEQRNRFMNDLITCARRLPDYYAARKIKK